MSELPIVCQLDALDDTELERQRTLVVELVAAAESVEELDEGFVVRLPAEKLKSAAELMDIERRCCAFLELSLTIVASEPYLRLTLEGPPGTKSFLKSELALRT